MRTIRVEHRVQADAQTMIVISTEQIVADDSEVEEAGRECRTAMTKFFAAYAEEES